MPRRAAAVAVGTGSDETKGRVSQALRSAENAQNLQSVNEAGGLDASWELDLIGKFRREVEAQTADAEALRDARDWALVTVAADVVRSYLDMRAQQRQLAVLGQNIAAARGNIDLAQRRFSRGLTNAIDVSLARRQVETCKPIGRHSSLKSMQVAMQLRSCWASFLKSSPKN